MSFLLSLVLLNPALAHDETTEEAAQPTESKATKSFANDKSSELQAHYAMQFLPEAPAHHVSLRAVGRKDAYLGGEVRFFPNQSWMGRGSVGLDVLGGSNLDVKLGMFIGGAGYVDGVSPVVTMRPQVGTEVALGATIGRLTAQYRWLGGFMGGTDPMFMENEFTAGFRVMPKVTVFGQIVDLEPGIRNREQGVGLGVRATF